MDKENMNSMKKKALAFAAAACAFGMLLSGCGSSNGGSAADKGSTVIAAYNSEPQNPLIPGDCNETGGGKPLDLLFARLISFDAKGNASVWVIDAANKLATRKIPASSSIGTSWLVESGLKAGDRVVFEGFERTRAGATVSPKEADASKMLDKTGKSLY